MCEMTAGAWHASVGAKRMEWPGKWKLELFLSSRAFLERLWLSVSSMGFLARAVKAEMPVEERAMTRKKFHL